jgi:hypothetical protein
MKTTHIVILSGLMIGSGQMAHADTLYWTENPSLTVKIANADGTGSPSTLFSNIPGGGNGIEAVGGFFYIPDQGASAVTRATFDGTIVTPLVTGVNAYDVDVTGTSLYWTEQNQNRIQRANLDGTSPTTVLTVPDPFAIDVTDTHLYWSEFFNRRLMQSDLDGTNPTPLVTELEIRDFEVTNGFIYLAGFSNTTFTTSIRRYNLDGTGQQNILTGLTGLINGIDVTDTHIYWSDFFGPIERANLDGSARTLLFTGPFGSTRGVAVLSNPVPEPATLTLLTLTTLMTTRSRAFTRRHHRNTSSPRDRLHTPRP